MNKSAVIAEVLYILTSLVPVIGFLALCGFYLRHRHCQNSLTRVHLKQAFIAGCLITSIFIIANFLIILLGGYHSINTIIIFEIYLMIFVPIFVFPGIMGLVKARSGQAYRYPIIGKFLSIE